MQQKSQTTLPIRECLSIPRFNYRTITESEKPELIAFSERLIKEGQLTSISIAKLSSKALKHKILKDLCGEGDMLLIDGERRLLAMEIACEKDIKHFSMVKVEFIPVHSLPEYLGLQMTYNMDRKNTSFTEDGFGFKRYLDNGGKKPNLLTSINFPEGVLTRKARLKYITDRIELLALHPDLYPYLNNGFIRPYKKTHQGYLILKFSALLQQKLAIEYAEIQQPKSNRELLGFFNKSRTPFINVPFDTEDERLGIEEFGTKACTNCPNLITTTEEEFFGSGGRNQQFCYQVDCFKAKRKKQIDNLASRLIEDKIPFVLLGAPKEEGWREKAEETLENGLTLIRYYKVVKEGACSHTIAGIPDGSSNSASLAKGVVHHVCPEKSKCTVHFPEKQTEQTVKRKERLTTEKSKVKKEAQMLAALEWGKQLLAGKIPGVYDELLAQYIYHSFGVFLRAIGSEAQKTFSLLVEESKEQPFVFFNHNKVRESMETFGMEKSWVALILAHLFHDFNLHWELITKWGEEAGIDFKAMLEANTKLNLKELAAKHKKRKAGWNKKEEVLQKKIHNLYFDLAYKIGFYDWDNEEALLAILKQENLGRKACRMIGVSLKDIEYEPGFVLYKLKGKKAELDTKFPDFALSDMEQRFLKVHLQLEETAVTKLMPPEIEFGVGLPFDFLRKCIDKADREGKKVAMADFLVATVEDRTITLLLFNSEATSVITKVTREESLTGYYKLKKEKKQIIFQAITEPVS